MAIRQQELALRGAEIQEKSRQFEEKQGLEREKERNDVLLAQQRLDLQEEANEERIRVADDRVQAQRDIAAANLSEQEAIMSASSLNRKVAEQMKAKKVERRHALEKRQQPEGRSATTSAS